MITLEQLYQHKLIELQRRQRQVPLAIVQQAADTAPEPRNFVQAIHQHPPIAVIAEFKQASPTTGTIRQADVAETVQSYYQGGAAALSIVSDEQFFQGRLDFITTAKAQVPLPVLRKDFMVDPYQVYESRAAGADALLLIVAMLSDEQLQTLSHLARQLGLQTVIEIHTTAELSRAVACQPTMLGINARNLHTMQVDRQTVLDLLPQVPPSITVVAESGVDTVVDVEQLHQAGADAVLVGSSLMRAGDPQVAVHTLTLQP